MRRRRRSARVADGEQAEALEGWAQAARFLGDGDASLDARARAFRAYRARGDARSAARAAAWLAYDTVVFRGDDAVAQGWFGHAHRLLGDADDSEEHGWLAFLEGEVALVAHGDAARAAEHAARALDVGRRTGVMDLEMLGALAHRARPRRGGRGRRRDARARSGDGRRGGGRAVRAALRRRRLLPHDLRVRARPRRRARRAVVRDGAAASASSGACRSCSASAAPTTRRC